MNHVYSVSLILIWLFHKSAHLWAWPYYTLPNVLTWSFAQATKVWSFILLNVGVWGLAPIGNSNSLTTLFLIIDKQIHGKSSSIWLWNCIPIFEGKKGIFKKLWIFLIPLKMGVTSHNSLGFHFFQICLRVSNFGLKLTTISLDLFRKHILCIKSPP